MKNKIITLMLFSMINIVGTANAKSLSVPEVIQEGRNWCWIASSKSILDYAKILNPNTHKLYKQCEILKWVFLNDNQPSNDVNATDVCLHPKNYYYLAELPPGAPGIIGKIGWDINQVINIEGSRTKPIRRALTFNEIKNEINTYSPILRYLGGHVTVVKGYIESGNKRKIIIMDPALGIFNTEYNNGVKNWIYSFKTDMKKMPNGMIEDIDKDGISDPDDNCKNIYNPNQIDTDGDGIGDKCDSDIDNDEINNADDNCKYIKNTNQEDLDNDGVGDVCDNCKSTVNSKQEDSDCDGIGDVCDNTPSIFGCSGHLYIQYRNRLWEIIHPLNPIESRPIFRIKTIPKSPLFGIK